MLSPLTAATDHTAVSPRTATADVLRRRWTSRIARPTAEGCADEQEDDEQRRCDHRTSCGDRAEGRPDEVHRGPEVRSIGHEVEGPVEDADRPQPGDLEHGQEAEQHSDQPPQHRVELARAAPAPWRPGRPPRRGPAAGPRVSTDPGWPARPARSTRRPVPDSRPAAPAGRRRRRLVDMGGREDGSGSRCGAHGYTGSTRPVPGPDGAKEVAPRLPVSSRWRPGGATTTRRRARTTRRAGPGRRRGRRGEPARLDIRGRERQHDARGRGDHLAPEPVREPRPQPRHAPAGHGERVPHQPSRERPTRRRSGRRRR